MGNTIAAIILTKDEEKHIARCIESLKGVCEEVFVIDCFSSNSLSRSTLLVVPSGIVQRLLRM